MLCLIPAGCARVRCWSETFWQTSNQISLFISKFPLLSTGKIISLGKFLSSCYKSSQSTGLPKVTKPLSEPISTNTQWGSVALAMASQITIVYSTVYSGTDQGKHQTPLNWPLCGEFTGDRWIPHKWTITRKMFPFDDVIMPRESFACFLHALMCAWTHWPLRDVEVIITMTSQVHHTVSNHRSFDCLSNTSCGPTSKKHQSPCYWPFEGNSPVTGEFPTQRASNAEKASIWWRHHVYVCICPDY